MTRAQHSFVNRKDGPVYVSVEPWPECFELAPGDKLTLVFDGVETGDALQIDFINDRELVVWPAEASGNVEILLNGQDALRKSWAFEHP